MNRRAMLAGAVAAFSIPTDAARAQPVAAAQAARPSAMPHLMFGDDPQFWFEALRVIGAADYGGAQFGEAMMTAIRIKPGDYDSWHDQWKATADAVAAEAQASLKARRRISARDGFLRASNYYRNAEFFLHANPADPRMREAYQRSVACFRHAASLLDVPVEALEIPYERTTLPGYFYRADASARGPLIIMHNGFDGSVEEMHFLGAQAAVERGYNVLAFDGPGQFGPLHREGLTFRPDWEKVVAPIVDYALTRSEHVDPARIALMGISMGGLLAPRAAAFEKRLAACIANDGIYDYGMAQLASVPPAYREEFKQRLRAERDDELDRMLARIMASSPTARWAMTHGMYAMGATSPRRYMAASLDYTLAGGIAESITCPTLVCEAEDDLFFADQPQLLYEHLTCPKTLLRFTAAEGAGAHCQVSASRLAFARIYDWLDAIFGR